jgi:prefoldin alpha subunit
MAEKQKKENKEKEKKLQEKFIEFQIMQQQLAQIQKNIQQLNTQKGEIEGIQQSLSELGDVNVDSDILVPICSGIFAKARLADNKELLVNVGNNVTVKKNIPEVKGLLAKQSAEVEKMEGRMKEQMEKLAEKAGEIEKELNGLIKEAKDNV